MRREFEKVACPNCNREVSAYVPHMGDGSALRLVKHNIGPGRIACPLSGYMIEYDGRSKLWTRSL